jgi:hypothetical protein
MTNKVNVTESPMRKYAISGIFSDIRTCVCFLQINKHFEFEDDWTNLDGLIWSMSLTHGFSANEFKYPSHHFEVKNVNRYTLENRRRKPSRAYPFNNGTLFVFWISIKLSRNMNFVDRMTRFTDIVLYERNLFSLLIVQIF